MNGSMKFAVVSTLVLVLGPLTSWAQDVDETPLGEAVERHLSLDGPTTEWVQDPDRVDEELGDQIEVRETLTDALETIKLGNLVEPIRFESGVANIPDSTVVSLAEILDRMKDRLNVRLHLVGHADNQPLSPRLEAIYGDNAGLSRERAGQVAEHFQTALALPAEAVSYEWAGDTLPVASNETEEGRSLNRRVEVEVWYDEVAKKAALEEFLVPHEIQRVKVMPRRSMLMACSSNASGRRSTISTTRKTSSSGLSVIPTMHRSPAAQSGYTATRMACRRLARAA
jgi:outer membrane protein OmpA-like peptidoglycan-associated protein